MNQILISRIFFTDMYKIIGDIEGDASFQGGRRSISPIPRGRSTVYDNPPEREPIRGKRYLLLFYLSLLDNVRSWVHYPNEIVIFFFFVI